MSLVVHHVELALGHYLEHSKETQSLVADLAGHWMQLVEEQVEETMLVARAELAVEPVATEQHVQLALKRKGNDAMRSP